MPGLYEYLKDPEVVSYLALRNNPQLADQMRRNDERNYAALLSARKAAAMPDFPQMESRGNPQIEWMNRTGQAISQMKDDPALFEEASKLYQTLVDRMAQSSSLTAEQRNNAWNGYNVPAEQSDPAYIPSLKHNYRMKEIERAAELRNYGGLGTAPTAPEQQKAPPGYRWKENGEQEPIPGGPADKFGEKQKNQMAGIGALDKAISEYTNALDNWSGWDAMSFDERAKMGTVYNNMLLQAKEAYNLGVLNGPDYQILQSVITDPRSLVGTVTSNEALKEQTRILRDLMQKTSQSVQSTPNTRGATGSWETPNQPSPYKTIQDLDAAVESGKITSVEEYKKLKAGLK